MFSVQFSFIILEFSKKEKDTKLTIKPISKAQNIIQTNNSPYNTSKKTTDRHEPHQISWLNSGTQSAPAKQLTFYNAKGLQK